MSATVISLDDHRPDPHLEGEARCLACAHEWIAVAPVGTHTLQCPDCQSMMGIFKHPAAAPGEYLWHCHCGCELMTISENGVYCYACGLRHGDFLPDED